MDPTLYSLLHVLSAVVLVGWTYAACANPAPNRRRMTMIVTGIASLVMLVGGFGLQAKLNTGFPPWLIVKIVCWFAISGFAALAFKRPLLAKPLALLVYALAAVAVYCVYMRPGAAA